MSSVGWYELSEIRAKMEGTRCLTEDLTKPARPMTLQPPSAISVS